MNFFSQVFLCTCANISVGQIHRSAIAQRIPLNLDAVPGAYGCITHYPKTQCLMAPFYLTHDLVGQKGLSWMAHLLFSSELVSSLT